MNVATILNQKGRGVTTARPTMTLLEVANKLAAKRIGAVVIIEAEGEVVGILSERDVMHALSTRGAHCLHQSVSESMTGHVVTCEETDTLEDLMEIMTARRFRHLVVVANDALVGIVSIGDVVKHHIDEVRGEAQAMRQYITHS